ncbi:hypothetical protein GTA08_BOTSDO03318 [Botryosphaeria dothidea]|uniref:Uncharacterized protein n=1 Tax=Botryosphaeria dothidea TaxID=55169 RepID=A0A8H4NBC8_9PEZI|nr:hypothetical protein GTA08_BOTSDO03318 [Botryosphaeria dothidea]
MSTCTSPRRAAAEPAVAAMDRDNDASSAPHPQPPNTSTSTSTNDHDSKLNTAILADDAEEVSRPAKRSKTSSQSPAAMSDADGDSTMHSTPTSAAGDSDDDLFPGANTTTAADATTTTGGGGVALPPSTPTTALAHAELSPPSSQGANTSATRTAASDAVINENGKRVLPTGLNFGGGGGGGGGSSSSSNRIVPSGDASVEGMLDGGSGKRALSGVHAASGYRWEREAEAPGWSWKNKKAQEEWIKAEEGLVERERMVKDRYGDPLEGAARRLSSAAAAAAAATAVPL